MDTPEPSGAHKARLPKTTLFEALKRIGILLMVKEGASQMSKAESRCKIQLVSLLKAHALLSTSKAQCNTSCALMHFLPKAHTAGKNCFLVVGKVPPKKTSGQHKQAENRTGDPKVDLQRNRGLGSKALRSNFLLRQMLCRSLKRASTTEGKI